MNFSASMALSLFLHGAVAVVVMAAPEPQEESVEALDAFVDERVIEFDPAGVVPREVRMVHVARADEGDPDEANVEESKPEPEPKTEPEPERMPEKEPAKAPAKPESEPEPEPVEEPAKVAKPVVAARDSEAPAEAREIANATDGVNDTHPTDGAGDVAAAGRRAPTTGNQGTQTGSARGTDRGSEGIDRAALLRSWLKEIYVQLQKRQRYPRAARRSRQQGKVVLQVWIDRAGKVVRAEIGDTSGHATLDRAALRLIKSITPVPPPPSELRWSTRPIKLPVTYKLR